MTESVLAGATMDIQADFDAKRSRIFIQRQPYCWHEKTHVPCSETRMPKIITSSAPGLGWFVCLLVSLAVVV